jgi:bifunctional DNase/RNase
MRALAWLSVIGAIGCVAAPPPQVATIPPAVRAPEPPRPPPGYVEVKVIRIEPQREGGAAILLGRPDKSALLPIFVGQTEALSIALRQKGEHYERPLTHDLVDALMRELGGQLVKVQIDELRNNTFVGSIFVRTGERVAEIDARPSDAIALAIGNHVPIYCATKVLDRAARSRDDKDEGPEEPRGPP